VTFEHKGETLSKFVGNHLRRVEDDLGDRARPIDEDIANSIVDDILIAERLREKYKREGLGLPCTRRYRLVYCRPEEATHLSLHSTFPSTIAVEAATVVGVRDYEPEEIAERREEAIRWTETYCQRNTHWIWE
jgi:hypothetical protein